MIDQTVASGGVEEYRTEPGLVRNCRWSDERFFSVDGERKSQLKS